MRQGLLSVPLQIPLCAQVLIGKDVQLQVLLTRDLPQSSMLVAMRTGGLERSMSWTLCQLASVTLFSAA